MSEWLVVRKAKEGKTSRPEPEFLSTGHTMSEPLPANDLSPLDQIRLVEAEITRRIIAARASSDERLMEARAQGARLKQEAIEAGGKAGLLRYKEIISAAEGQAQMILAQAEREAQNLRRKGDARMEQAITEAVNIVLGRKAADTSDEP